MLVLILAALLQLPPQASDATIGVTAIHLETGQRLSVRNAERFPMGSVYKFPIALAVLKRVDSGTLSLNQSVTIEPWDFSPGHSPLRDEAQGKPVTMTLRELLRSMVSLSDNTASDTLLRMVGTQAVNARLAELGASGIRVDRTEKQMASDLKPLGGAGRYAVDVRDTATPDGMADLLVAFWQGRDGLSKESHDLLVHWMTVTPTGSRRVKAGLPNGATFVHKAGTMPGTTNDVGIIVSPDGKQHIALAVFTKSSRRDITEDQEDDIAAIARKVYTLLIAE
jgi:beta-lactamase class A